MQYLDPIKDFTHQNYFNNGDTIVQAVDALDYALDRLETSIIPLTTDASLTTWGTGVDASSPVTISILQTVWISSARILLEVRNTTLNRQIVDILISHNGDGFTDATLPAIHVCNKLDVGIPLNLSYGVSLSGTGQLQMVNLVLTYTGSGLLEYRATTSGIRQDGS